MALDRVRVDGKHLLLDGERFVVKGVTYGSFGQRDDGYLFPAAPRIEADMQIIKGLGLNTVRCYSHPPRDLLEAAATSELRVLAGIDFRDWRFEVEPGRPAQRRVLEAGRRALHEAMETCSGHEAVLALSVANEVPADIVRTHGIGAIEDVLAQLVAEAHRLDPGLLVTYTSFPTTEYLEIEGLDLACFNVFLERPDDFERYVRHLHTVSGALPLVITELGLASGPHGEDAQAEVLSDQLQLIDEIGCAGATVFSFTDEWWVNGHSVDGWGFGITRSDRTRKAGAEAVARWCSRGLKDLRPSWPRVSVVVCAYNEEATLGDCLGSLERSDYPDLEVIVCDDGSTDRTLEVAQRFPFTVVSLPHGGLSQARNAGLDAASGEVVAYLDADAMCHPQWPWFLALSLDDPGVVATGGPNLPFVESSAVELAVALSPGAPQEVLLSDDRAEHVAGCNMAFRRDALRQIGGFNPLYTSAGDDVDVCWKLLDAGGHIAFSPAAQVHHHRRNTVKGYLRQQRGYGRAERLLRPHHGHRFNRFGQVRWAGFIYGSGRLLPSLLRPVVYHGHQGHAPFQAIHRRRSEVALMWAGALLPLVAPLMGVSLLLSLVNPWYLWGVGGAFGALAGYAGGAGAAARLPRATSGGGRVRLLVGLLHVLQPFARAWGRVSGPLPPRPPTPIGSWTGDRSAWLTDLERFLGAQRPVRVGGPHDSWDLEVAGLVRARLTTAVAWSWEPQWRVRRYPSGLLGGLAGLVVLALAIAGPQAALVAAASLAGLTAVSWLRVSRLTISAARKSCQGAWVGGSGASARTAGVRRARRNRR